MEKRVLIVDDNRDAATMLSMLVSALGFETQVVHDGLAAVSTAEEYRPQLVILDISLPGIDGREVARRIRQQDWSQSTVIAASTGWSREKLADDLNESTFDHFLPKPASLELLQSVLNSVR